MGRRAGAPWFCMGEGREGRYRVSGRGVRLHVCVLKVRIPELREGRWGPTGLSGEEDLGCSFLGSMPSAPFCIFCCASQGTKQITFHHK